MQHISKVIQDMGLKTTAQLDKEKAQPMLCPMCSTALTWNPVHTADNVTHIYVCPECPFIGLEYFTDKNIEDLKTYLNK